jgi:hypothetical protein
MKPDKYQFYIFTLKKLQIRFDLMIDFRINFKIDH